MIISRCCKDSIYVAHDYYVCERCSLPCDTISSISLRKDMNDDDATDDGQAETFIGETRGI